MAKRMPKGDAITAATRKITHMAAASTPPPTRADRAPISSFTAFTVAWAARLDRSAAAWAVCLDFWSIPRWASRWAFLRARSAIFPAAAFLPAGPGALAGAARTRTACSAACRALGLIVPAAGFSFSALECRGRSLIDGWIDRSPVG